jgi:hypothetical protein
MIEETHLRQCHAPVAVCPLFPKAAGQLWRFFEVPFLQEGHDLLD